MASRGEKAVIFVLLLLCPSSVLAVGLAARRHKATVVVSPPTPPQPAAAVPAPPSPSSCDIYTGSWVLEPAGASPAYYNGSSCPAIDGEFNCQLYGRPDSDYLRYRWRPAGCDLPRFDGLDFLRRMRGKTVLFVGDSLGRNQWESLVCLLRAAAPSSPLQLAGDSALYTYKFPDYGVAISFYRAPYLVDIDVVAGRRVLRLDDISGNSAAWGGADVLSFNSGHWWTHTGPASQGWDSMEYGGTYYNDMDRLVAYEKALTTWAQWVDLHVDLTKTAVYFQSVSPTHYNSRAWGSTTTRNCFGESGPATAADLAANAGGAGPAGPLEEQPRVIRSVLGRMRSPVRLLDITALSAQRKDAHPSLYSGDLSPAQRSNPNSTAAAAVADCSHWCLPGLPDTWNQLFYASLFYL